MTRSQRGFTLIELLVVIAIIGLLSAIILAALSTAHNQGVDAQIKSDLHTAVAQANIDFDSYPRSYGPTTAFTAETPTQLRSVGVGTGAPGGTGVSLFGTATHGDSSGQNAMFSAGYQGGMLYVGNSGSKFFLAVPLTSVSGAYWCVDSEGHAKQENSTPTAAAYASDMCP